MLTDFQRLRPTNLYFGLGLCKQSEHDFAESDRSRSSPTTTEMLEIHRSDWGKCHKIEITFASFRKTRYLKNGDFIEDKDPRARIYAPTNHKFA